MDLPPLAVHIVLEHPLTLVLAHEKPHSQPRREASGQPGPQRGGEGSEEKLEKGKTNKSHYGPGRAAERSEPIFLDLSFYYGFT